MCVLSRCHFWQLINSSESQHSWSVSMWCNFRLRYHCQHQDKMRFSRKIFFILKISHTKSIDTQHGTKHPPFFYGCQLIISKHFARLYRELVSHLLRSHRRPQKQIQQAGWRRCGEHSTAQLVEQWRCCREMKGHDGGENQENLNRIKFFILLIGWLLHS